MALLTPGYWPNTYWPSNYWQDDYWPEFVAPIPIVEAIPPRGGGRPYSDRVRLSRLRRQDDELLEIIQAMLTRGILN